MLRGGDEYEAEGLIGRTARDFFNLIEISHQANSSKNEYALKLSIYQIFNENIYDLLDKNSVTPLQITKLTDNETGELYTKINKLSELDVKNLNIIYKIL